MFVIVYVWVQVQVLTNPSTDEFQRVLHSLEPSIVYFQGEQIEDSEEIGPLRWGDIDLSTPESLCGLFGSTLPPTVSDGPQDWIILVAPCLSFQWHGTHCLS